MLESMTLDQATNLSLAQQFLPELEGCDQLRIFIRQKKVTASVSWHGRKFGSRGTSLPDALAQLVARIKEIG